MRQDDRPSSPTSPDPERRARLPSGLYLVATPIGNLEDLSPRARRVIADADRVLCEDTRVTGKLLHLSDLSRPLATYHEHNAERVRPQVLAALERGEAIALLSDAGTPLISDPGFKLVRAARDAGFQVTTVPGAAAPLAALVASGLPTDRFFFQGFLPVKAAARDAAIAELAPLRATLVFFESAPRVAACLDAMARRLGEREAVLARELTKLHETFERGTLTSLAKQCAARPPRGEIVLVVAGASADAGAGLDDAAVDAALTDALRAMTPSEAARRIAKLTGWPKRALYARALELRAR